MLHLTLAYPSESADSHQTRHCRQRSRAHGPCHGGTAEVYAGSHYAMQVHACALGVVGSGS